jgi:hypothetical protein
MVANFLEKKLNFSPKSKAVQALFSFSPKASVAGLAYLGPGAAAGGVAALSAYNGIKVLMRVSQSPTLRKYYKNVLSNAVKGNVGATSKNLKALDSGLLRMEEKRSDEIQKQE